MNIKKIVLRTVPYVCIALYGTKIGQAWRLAAGTAFAEKFLHWGDGFMQALASPLPSFHPQDVLAGMAIAAGFYAAVYVKGKNAKKFRHNVEYGSARWAVLLLLMSSNKKEIKSRKQANSKGKGKRAVRRKGR